MANEQVRKQVYDLSAQDFLEHPLWEFCSDEEDVEGQDEATVKPTEEAEVPGYSPGAYVVAAKVIYANGTLADGYIYSGKPDDFGCLQPNILLPTGQINLWLGSLRYLPDPNKIAADRMNLLGGAGVFPVTFETRANVNGAPLKVIAQGFLARNLNDQMVKLG
jgi:hypothetical protein